LKPARKGLVPWRPPFEPVKRAHRHGDVVWLRFIAGRHDEAVELWERLPLIAWYESQGQHEKAREITQEVLHINPDFSLERAREFPSSMRIQRLGLSPDLLRRAGLP
jgi:hypothetical protein